jgi:hypothetical protein
LHPLNFISDARDPPFQVPKDKTERPLYQAQALDSLAHSFEIAIATTVATTNKIWTSEGEVASGHRTLHPLRKQSPSPNRRIDFPAGRMGESPAASLARIVSSFALILLRLRAASQSSCNWRSELSVVKVFIASSLLPSARILFPGTARTANFSR